LTGGHDDGGDLHAFSSSIRACLYRVPGATETREGLTEYSETIFAHRHA